MPSGSRRCWPPSSSDTGHSSVEYTDNLPGMKSYDVAAVVAGGASGLGEATPRALAARGAAVTILDLQEERGKALADELGGHTTFVRTHRTDPAALPAARGDATR